MAEDLGMSVSSFGTSDGKSMGYDIFFERGPVIAITPSQAVRLHELLGVALSAPDAPSPAQGGE